MSYLSPQNPHDDPRIEGADYLRNTPMPVPYGRYASSMGNPPMGRILLLLASARTTLC